MKLILVSLVTIILLTSIIAHESFAKSKDKKARDAIVKAIGRSVEGKYSSITMVNISTASQVGVTVYNKSGGTVTPPPPIPTCMSGWHYDNVLKECVQDNPTPQPTPIGFNLCFAGDLSGNAVPDAMKKQCSFRIGLGDLGYKSDLSWFKSLGFDKCIIGNHDAPEDGSSSIYKEALAYCGDSWWTTIGNSTLILGFNTNGNIQDQLTAAKSVVSSHSSLKNIIALSHKNGHVFPSAHHPAEATSLYSQLESNMPNGVTLWEVGGHNHNSAAADAKHWYIAGGGGKSFYTCGKDVDWTYCDNSHKAFLQFTISDQGSITPNFYDTSGKLIH